MMKKMIILTALVSGMFLCRAQGENSVSELCIGSGVHCAILNYGSIKMTFVKSPKAPGIRIKEANETKDS